MNWGNKIAIVIIVFILIMLTMVYVSFQQTNEMEDSNYYDIELKYQSKIDAANNLNKISNDTLLTQNESGIIIHIPAALNTGFDKGKFELLRIDDQKKDLSTSFVPDSSGVYLIERSKLSNGIYKARIEWDNEQIHYYKEQTIYFQQ